MIRLGYDEFMKLDKAKPTVFFDGGCPLCRREIAHYQRLGNADVIEWLDISTATEQLDAFGMTYDQAMALFHVRDADGVMHVGAYAFVTMWSYLNGYRHLARLIRLFRLTSLMDKVYRRFAKRRLKHRCNDIQCS